MTAMRPDLAVIAETIPTGARVLDVGCGDGALMAALRDSKGIDARGMEIDPVNVANAVTRGLAVVQGDADTDLADYPDDAFDVVILSNTLQAMHRVETVLREVERGARARELEDEAPTLRGPVGCRAEHGLVEAVGRDLLPPRVHEEGLPRVRRRVREAVGVGGHEVARERLARYGARVMEALAEPVSLLARLETIHREVERFTRRAPRRGYVARCAAQARQGRQA